MHRQARVILEQFANADGGMAYDELGAILDQATKPVPWAYGVWDVLRQGLTDPDNHKRAIASRLLCHLALSDPKKRILKDLDALMAVTRDPRFVTARHTVQALWRIGLAGQKQRHAIVARLVERFADCASEKNATLIRYDIAVGLRSLYDATKDARVKQTALDLIATEPDDKYRKKYAAAWRGA